MPSPFSLIRPTIKGASVTFELTLEDGRVWFDFKGQHVERFGLDATLARAVAKSLLEKADRLEHASGVVVQ